MSTDRLRSCLRTFISDSERVFLNYGEKYPVFVREMKLSLDRSGKEAASLGDANAHAGRTETNNGTSGEATVEKMLGDLFLEIKKVITESVENFQNLHGRDATLFDSLSRGMNTLAGLDTIIARIKDDSIEMELISLNAMTVALKSGHAGKAFSVITDELKRLSSRTIALTDQLTDDRKSILESFRKYRAEVERLEQFQTDFFAGLDERIQTEFDSLERDIHALALEVSTLVSGSREVETPVRDIMETVQVHDIVRQSLNHVGMALDELEPVTKSCAGRQEADTDDMIFMRQLASLSLTMLGAVRTELATAIGRFKDRSRQIQHIVEVGEKRRRELLDGSFGTDDSGRASLSFARAADTLSSVSNQVVSYMRTKDSIVSNGKTLAETVSSLDTRFKEFAKILNRFRTIDVASRIEVSKQSVLGAMRDTVVEMSALTDRIGADVDEAVLTTRGFIEETRSSMVSYTAVSGNELDIVERSRDRLFEAVRRLEQLRGSIKSSARNFSLFTSEFIGMLEDTSREICSLDALLPNLDAIMAEFEKYRHSCEDCMIRRGLSPQDEGVHSERFREIIERFTIYAHKRAAADIGGFQVEDGAGLGEVTLF